MRSRLSRGDYYGVREMRAVELNSSYLGFDEELMMENAGAWVARLSFSKGSSFLVLVGKGGKGGDGLVAARHLALLGADVKVLMPYKECEIKKKSTLKNLKRAKMSGVKFVSSFESADVIIDALLGTGVRGEPRGIARSLILEANERSAYKIAIDLPSGMDPETGECKLCFEADLIITMHRPKPGLRGMEDKVFVAEIGIPRRADDYLGPGDLLLAPRGERKGKNGRVGVVGGSSSYQGAPWISAMTSFRLGADLVFLYTPTHMPFPELIWRKRENLIEQLEKDKVNVLLVGPGLGDEALEVTKQALEYAERTKAKLVLDADSLKALPELSPKLEWRAILTPHLGEARKLLGEEVADDLDSRIEAAKRISNLYEACVILKGPVDVVACGNKAVLNDTGNSFMTVGGTGDALSGMAAAFLARDDPWWAAKAAAFLNGATGERCYQERGHASPTCIAEEAPKVLKEFTT